MKTINISTVLLAAVLALASCGWEDPLAGLAGPEHEVIKPKARGFTVMSYNIYGARGLALEEDYAALASAIRYVNPDFVLLQEVDSCTKRQGEIPCNSAMKLMEILDTTTMYKWDYNYSPAEYNLYSQGGAYGDAILSRHEILWEKDYVMTYAEEHATDSQREKRSVGVIKTMIDTNVVYIGCTHFDHLATEHSRIHQAQQLKEIVAEYEGEIFVLGGDFNAKPDSETMGIVTEYLTPSYTDPTQYTFPSLRNADSPSNMIDYVMMANYSNQIVCSSSNILNTKASDHCAVYATYHFAE